MKERNLYSDKELVIRLQKGNVDAFERLYENYSLRLYHFGMKYLKSDIEAEGLVQNVFAKVWEKRSSLKEELSFKSYIFTIAFNFIRKVFIKKSQLREYLQSGKGSDDIDIDTINQIEYQSLADYLNTIVIQLPKRRREVFIKSRIEDLSVKEIAKQMNISPKTVENQLASAIQFVRDNWQSKNLSAILFLALFVIKNF